MKKIKILGSSLFISILLAFLLPLPIMKATKSETKVLNTQTSIQSQQPGNQTFRVALNIAAFTVTVNTNAISLLTPTTIPQKRDHWEDPKGTCFSYSHEAGGAYAEYVKIVNINQHSGNVEVMFCGDSPSTGDFHGPIENLKVSLDVGVPSFSVNSAGSVIAPSLVTPSNFLNYVNEIDTGKSFRNATKFTANNNQGTLKVEGSYYLTTFHGDGSPKGTFTTSISGFAMTGYKPTLRFKSNDNQILPSLINDANYNTYIEVDDSTGSLIASSVDFKADDITGKLTVSGVYYTTNNKTSSAPTDNFSYDSSDFAHTSIVPSLNVKSVASKVAPSTINSTNFNQYFDIEDPDKALISSSLKFGGNDAKGTLTITGSYYVTSYHKAGATTTKYEPASFSGFSFKDSNGKGGKGRSNNTAVIASVCIVILVLLFSLGFWYYFKKINPNKNMRNRNQQSSYPNSNNRNRQPQLDYREPMNRTNNNSSSARNSRINHSVNNQNPLRIQGNQSVRNQNSRMPMDRAYGNMNNRNASRGSNASSFPNMLTTLSNEASHNPFVNNNYQNNRTPRNTKNKNTSRGNRSSGFPNMFTVLSSKTSHNPKGRNNSQTSKRSRK